MNIQTMPIPVQNALSRHYIEQNTDVLHTMYEFHPDQDWAKRVEWLDQASCIRADQAQLITALSDYQHNINAHEQAFASLERLRDPKALVVVGGQQGGLLMGPLLMIYKAISIIRMAQEAELTLGRPVVPVFWVAGEDHDYDEVNHTYLLTSEPAVKRIRLSHSSEGRTPVSYLHLTDETWEEALNEVESILPQTEFKEELMSDIRHIAAESDSLTEQCARIVAKLFGEYGLVLLDSADPALRKVEQAMFAELIHKQVKLKGAVEKSEEAVLQAGYELQAVHHKDSANLFYIHKGERVLLLWDGVSYRDREGQVQFTSDELLAELEQHPERFSNNVLTRPLMQEYLFPVLATVLGAGEIAYWAQLKESFRAMDMRMPLLWPRMSFTLIEGTLQKLLTKYAVTVEDICFSYEEKREAWLADQDHIHLDERFKTLHDRVDAEYKELLQVLSESLPALGKLGDTNHAKVLEQIEFLHHRAKDALSKQHETGLRHWERLKTSIWPLDRPQERVLNPIQYACRHGQQWFLPIMEAPVVWNGEHRLVSL